MKCVLALSIALLFAPLAAPTREALEWTKANRALNPSSAVSSYGWNENDAGGGRLPTLSTDGKPDKARINAVGKTVRPK